MTVHDSLEVKLPHDDNGGLSGLAFRLIVMNYLYCYGALSSQ